MHVHSVSLLPSTFPIYFQVFFDYEGHRGGGPERRKWRRRRRIPGIIEEEEEERGVRPVLVGLLSWGETCDFSAMEVSSRLQAGENIGTVSFPPHAAPSSPRRVHRRGCPPGVDPLTDGRGRIKGNLTPGRGIAVRISWGGMYERERSCKYTVTIKEENAYSPFFAYIKIFSNETGECTGKGEMGGSPLRRGIFCSINQSYFRHAVRMLFQATV